MSTLKKAPLQEILETQGYLIISSSNMWEPGSLMPDAHAGDGYMDIPGPLMVIGMTDFEAWRQQSLRFNNGREPSAAGRRRFFYKVVAE